MPPSSLFKDDGVPSKNEQNRDDETLKVKVAHQSINLNRLDECYLNQPIITIAVQKE